MRPRYFILVTAVAAVLVGGCFYKKLGKVYGKAYGNTVGKVVPSLPSGGDGGPMAGAATQYAQTADLMAQYEQTNQQVAAVEQPAHDEPVRDQPAYEEPVRERPADRETPTTITHTVKRAPTYPSSPFIAIYPVARGSDSHVCRAFTDSTDNKGACMAECRVQLMTGPGSCTCNEMESCPSGTKVLK